MRGIQRLPRAARCACIQRAIYGYRNCVYRHDSDAKRLHLFEDVNEAKVKVVIGSTSKLGTGVNMQARLIAAHHLDAPYRPADLEQRNGRLVRQGNLNPYVYINYYSTKGTFDSYRGGC